MTYQGCQNKWEKAMWEQMGGSHVETHGFTNYLGLILLRI